MTGMTGPDAAPEDNPEISAFWNLAKYHAKLNSMPTYFGPTPLESLPPPAWGFEDDGALERMLSGGGFTMTGDRAEYGDELPETGALGIVCDADGRPRALVATSGVTVTDEQVSEEITVVWAPDE